MWGGGMWCSALWGIMWCDVIRNVATWYNDVWCGMIWWDVMRYICGIWSVSNYWMLWIYEKANHVSKYTIFSPATNNILCWTISIIYKLCAKLCHHITMTITWFCQNGSISLLFILTFNNEFNIPYDIKLKIKF